MLHFEWQYHDEKVLLKRHEHKVRFILRSMPIWIGILLLGTIISIIGHFTLESSLFTGLSCVTTIVFLMLYIFFIIKFHKETFFAFTNKRAIKSVRNWLFASHIKELKLENIKQTTANNFGMVGKICTYWNINVQWPDENTSLYFRAIPENKNIVLYISRMLDYIKEHWADTELWEYKSGYKKENSTPLWESQ